MHRGRLWSVAGDNDMIALDGRVVGQGPVRGLGCRAAGTRSRSPRRGWRPYQSEVGDPGRPAPPGGGVAPESLARTDTTKTVLWIVGGAALAAGAAVGGAFLFKPQPTPGMRGEPRAGHRTARVRRPAMREGVARPRTILAGRAGLVASGQRVRGRADGASPVRGADGPVAAQGHRRDPHRGHHRGRAQVPEGLRPKSGEADGEIRLPGTIGLLAPGEARATPSPSMVSARSGGNDGDVRLVREVVHHGPRRSRGHAPNPAGVPL